MILGKFSASVFVENKPLTEYQTFKSSTRNENRITCWIASEAGKKFHIRGEVPQPQHPGLMSSVSVDGFECPSWAVFPPWTGTLEFDCVSQNMLCRTLMFEKIDFTDDDSALGNHTDHIGQIVMRMQRGTYYRAKPTRKKSASPVNSHIPHVHEDKVHERLKKGRCHRVGFGKEAPDHYKQTTYEDWSHNCPATVFIFKYTSLDNLQAMDIVPRTQVSNPPILRVKEPSSEVQPLPIDVQIRKLKSELKRLQAERATTVNNSSSSRDHKPSPIKIEIIDLTID